jgi:broad specificity phosphatase PhoE
MRVETKIYTIRHAQTEYGLEKRYAGTIDVPLNEKGIQEAREASRKLAGIKFDIVITSTQKRSVETACLLVNNGIPIIQNRLCNERNFGVMEGHTWNEVQNLEPRVLFIEVGAELHSVNPKGGEPLENVWERAKRFQRFVFKKYKGSTVLIVSHGVFLQMFHGVLRGLNCIESLSAYPSNLELTCFRFSGNRLIEHSIMKLDGAEAFQW